MTESRNSMVDQTMGNRTLAEWLAYIPTLSKKSVDFSMERPKEIAEKMGLLDFECPVVTVGGTNGKGSTVTLMEQCLVADGYRVGCFTSPHLISYCERIRVNGEMIFESEFADALSAVEDARLEIMKSHETHPTLYEYFVLAALSYFKRCELDVLLLEVGCGGRLDAVNIISPDIAVITNIALDHVGWLGDTREAIGREKAGILRENCPFVLGDLDPPTTVITRAKALRSEEHTS